MKTKEELKALKEKEVESESKERQKLTDEELAQVCGGRTKAADLSAAEVPSTIVNATGKKQYENRIYTFETVEEAKRKFLGE